MRHSVGLAQPALSGSKLEAYDGASWRTWSGVLAAMLLHLIFLVVAYLRPLPPGPRKSPPIVMDVVVRPPPPPPAPPTPPPTPPPQVTPQKVVQPTSRPLPRELYPVKRETTPDAHSSAISVPAQPPPPPTNEPPGELPKGPINLFPKTLSGVVGGPGINAPIPTGPNRLIKDERLEPKKEADFELIPEKGGGYRCETKNFVAHIKPDGALEFSDRFPIGFNKGGTFSFDLTDLAMRGKKQDPYAAEKRKFIEFSDKVRSELRKKALQESQDQALATLSDQLTLLWRSSRSAASRRREMYEIWADSSDDKSEKLSRKGRRIIEDFIRANLPEGSSDGYTAEELSRIAGERQNLPPFDPYRTGLK